MYTFYNPFVLVGIVLIPAIAALWFLGTSRAKMSAFFGGIAFFGLHMALVVLAEADWASIYHDRLYEEDTMFIESSNGIGLLPDAVFALPIVIGLGLFATSAILAWREKLEYRKSSRSRLDNDETQEVGINDLLRH